MWTLYNLQQTTHQSASELLNLRRWMQEQGALGDGWWEALQLDRAVGWFGRHVENKLMERNKQGQPVYTLEMLLDLNPDEARQRAQFDAFAAALGVG
jgi:hypothetical protein